MTGKKDPQNMADGLRKRAKKIASDKTPAKQQALSPAAIQKLLHEMRVHQIELEMQNEELRTAQEKLAASREQYFELYDVAPVGYFSVSEKGVILEANLTGANLLGVVPRDLRAQQFSHFIYKEDQDTYYQHRRQLFETGLPQICEMRMVCKDGSLFWARVDGSVTQDGKSGKPVCHAAVSDITSRKRMEQALQLEHGRAQQYLDIASIILVSIASDQTITLINRKGCELLGYAHKELVGKNWFDTVLPEDERAKVKEVFTRLMRGELESVEHVENYVHTRSGEKRLISWHNTLLRDADGNITVTLSSGEDITERKQAEEALRTSEEKFRTLYENAPVLIDSFDNNGRCILWNQECQKVFGWTIDEINAHAEPLALFYPDPNIRKEVIATVTSKPGNIFREWHPLTKDGKELTVLWANFQLPGAVVINVGHDITRRKKAEEELIDLSAYNRSLIEASIDPLVTIDHAGNISDVNAATEQITGLPRQDLIGTDFSDYFTQPEKAREGYRQVFTDGTVRDYPLEIRHRDGHAVEVLYNASVYRDKSGKISGVFAAARDITERKRLEEEQQKVAKLESIGILAAGIAHNFNNILTVILGNISLAKIDSKPGSENHEVLDQAEKASLRAKDLTAQLLTFAKGGAPLKKITSLAELLQHTANSALRGSNVKCHFSISADLRQAEIDAVQVRQVIHNLVTNAQQAMPAGGTIEITAENVSINAMQHQGKDMILEAGDYVMISVTDHGSGISEKTMGNIFVRWSPESGQVAKIEFCP